MKYGGNKEEFILLSKVAKENGYAQEYLSLLARRGDLGSIRIGKRWYTTKIWMEEFQRDGENRREAAETIPDKKASVLKISDTAVAGENISATSEVKIQPRTRTSAPVEVKAYSPPFSRPFPNRHYVSAQSGTAGFSPLRESKPVIFSKRFENASPLISGKEKPARRRILRSDIVKKNNFNKTNYAKIQYGESRNTIKEKDQHSPAVLPRVERARYHGLRSPNFVGRKMEESDRDYPSAWGFSQFAGRLAFGFSTVLVLALLVVGGVPSLRRDFQKLAGFGAGIVAGATDSKNEDVSFVKLSAGDYLKKQSDAIKENFSIFRVFLRASVEKSGGQAASVAETPMVPPDSGVLRISQ